MAETGAEETADRVARPDSPFTRLAEARWLILGLCFFLGVLALAGVVAPAAALVVALGVVALLALVPRRPAAPRAVSPAGPTEMVWPETAIKLFTETLPDPCFVVDRRAVVRYANRRAIEAFSIRPGDALTSRLRIPDLIAAFDRVARGGGPERVEFAERVPTERWFAAWLSRLDAGGHPGNFIALILDDVTEPRRLDRVRVDFVANASHELRTPLASLAGFIETLQGPARDDPVARERFLKIMADQATRMSRLVDDLLSLSRIEMKAHVRPSGEVDLSGLIRHVADALEPLARELGVELEFELPNAAVVVTGDRDELVQVFENLIENACKYGQAGGRVEVAVRPATGDRGPSASVRDFGPGIAQEHIPRLTERFYRIDVDQSRRHRGTGLGLAIVKHILTRHQARLVVESQVGEGSLFTIVFPPGQIGEAGDREEKTNTDQLVDLS